MLLLDANVLVALVDERDELYERAWSDLDRLGHPSVVVVEPVLAEAIYLLPRSHLRFRLRQWLTSVGYRVWAPASHDAFWLDVFLWLDRYAEHTPDCADAYLAVASAAAPKAKVWTYDSEFRTLWRRPDGKRIPLAV